MPRVLTDDAIQAIVNSGLTQHIQYLRNNNLDREDEIALMQRLHEKEKNQMDYWVSLLPELRGKPTLYALAFEAAPQEAQRQEIENKRLYEQAAATAQSAAVAAPPSAASPATATAQASAAASTQTAASAPASTQSAAAAVTQTTSSGSTTQTRAPASGIRLEDPHGLKTIEKKANYISDAFAQLKDLNTELAQLQKEAAEAKAAASAAPQTTASAAESKRSGAASVATTTVTAGAETKADLRTTAGITTVPETKATTATRSQDQIRQDRIAVLKNAIDQTTKFINDEVFSHLSEDERVELLQSNELTPDARGQLLLSQTPQEQKLLLEKMEGWFSDADRASFLNKMNGKDVGTLLGNLEKQGVHEDKLVKMFREIATLDKQALALSELINSGNLELAAKCMKSLSYEKQAALLSKLSSDEIAKLYANNNMDNNDNNSEDVDNRCNNMLAQAGLFADIGVILLVAAFDAAMFAPLVPFLAPAVPFLLVGAAIAITVALIETLWAGAAKLWSLIFGSDDGRDKNAELLADEKVPLEQRTTVFKSMPVEKQYAYLSEHSLLQDFTANHYFQTVEDPRIAAELLHNVMQKYPRRAQVFFNCSNEQRQVNMLIEMGVSEKGRKTAFSLLNNMKDPVQKGALIQKLMETPEGKQIASKFFNEGLESAFHSNQRARIEVLNGIKGTGQAAMDAKVDLIERLAKSPDGLDKAAELFSKQIIGKNLDHEGSLLGAIAQKDAKLAADIVARNGSRANDLLNKVEPREQASRILTNLAIQNPDAYNSVPMATRMRCQTIPSTRNVTGGSTIAVTRVQSGSGAAQSSTGADRVQTATPALRRSS